MYLNCKIDKMTLTMAILALFFLKQNTLAETLKSDANDIKFCTHDGIVKQPADTPGKKMVAITCVPLSDPKKLSDLLVSSLEQEPSKKMNPDRTFKNLDSLSGGSSGTSMFVYFDTESQRLKIAKDLPYPPQDYVVWNSPNRKEAWERLGFSKVDTIPLGYIHTDSNLDSTAAEEKITKAFEELNGDLKNNPVLNKRKSLQCGLVGMKVANAVKSCLNEVTQLQTQTQPHIQPQIKFEGLGSSDILTKFSGIYSPPSGEMLTLGDKASGSFYAFSSTDGLVYKFEKAYPLKDKKLRFRLNQTEYNYIENYSATTDSYLKGVYADKSDPSHLVNEQIKEYQTPKKQGSPIGIDGDKKFRDLLDLKLIENFQMLLSNANKLLPTIQEKRKVQICLTHHTATYGGFKKLMEVLNEGCKNSLIVQEADNLNHTLFNSSIENKRSKTKPTSYIK